MMPDTAESDAIMARELLFLIGTLALAGGLWLLIAHL